MKIADLSSGTMESADVAIEKLNQMVPNIQKTAELVQESFGTETPGVCARDRAAPCTCPLKENISGCFVPDPWDALTR